MPTKKNVLIGSFSVFLIFMATAFFQGTCSHGALGLCWRYWVQINVFIETLFISTPFFLVALIVYFMRDEIFQKWIKFVFVWVPLTLLLTVMTPEFGGQGIITIEKGTMSFIFSALFLLISLIIIIYKTPTLRSLKKISVILSGLSGLILLILNFIPDATYCTLANICDEYVLHSLHIDEYLFPCFVAFSIFFLFSCITYFLRNEVFKTWFWLGIIYVPVSIIWSFNTPITGGVFFGWSPSLMSILIAIPFFILSTAVILFAHFYYKNRARK